MSDHSGIEWTDATWNPTTGCTKISPGCAHCYIERTPAFRIHGRRFVDGHIPVQLHADRLEQPLHWKKPRRVFVNSLSDLFHEDVPDSFIDRVFEVMALCPQHTFQVLTKRAERMLAYCARLDDRTWPWSHVWLGVSVENQHFADARIPLLLRTPAAVRFISAEPLLGPVDLTFYLPEVAHPDHELDWVIVGGESGPQSRPFDLAWARAIVAQCQAAGAPVFVKQLGECAYDGATVEPTGRFRTDPNTGRRQYEVTTTRLRLHRKGGDMGEWPDDLRVRQYPLPRGTSQTSEKSQT